MHNHDVTFVTSRILGNNRGRMPRKCISNTEDCQDGTPLQIKKNKPDGFSRFLKTFSSIFTIFLGPPIFLVYLPRLLEV